jgi:NADH pyrophosphatase NudC (nudix superfamily)
MAKFDPAGEWRQEDMAHADQIIQVLGRRESAWEKRRRVYFCERCGSRCEATVTWGSTLEKDVCSRCGNVHFLDPSPAVAVVVIESYAEAINLPSSAFMVWRACLRLIRERIQVLCLWDRTALLLLRF